MTDAPTVAPDLVSATGDAPARVLPDGFTPDGLPAGPREDFTLPRLTLRAIITELAALDALIDAAEGEITPEVEAEQSALFEALQAKADGIVDYLRALDAEAAHLKAEEIRIGTLRKRLESRWKGLADYVALQMQRRDLKTLSGAEYTNGIRLKSSQSVDVTDEAALPDEFLRIETTSAPDKKAIGAALKAGKVVPGATLATNYSITLP